MSATMPAVLTLEEAADYLRLPPDTIAHQADHGAIPCLYRALNLDRLSSTSAGRSLSVGAAPPVTVGYVVLDRGKEAKPIIDI